MSARLAEDKQSVYGEFCVDEKDYILLGGWLLTILLLQFPERTNEHAMMSLLSRLVFPL